MYFSNRPLMIMILVIYSLVPGLHATEIVGGKLLKNTTFSPDNGVYIVTQELLVPEGITLTIEPGTELQFMLNSSLEVNGGTLIAEGTPENLIRFSAYDTNAWKGITICNSSTRIDESGQLSDTRLKNIIINDAANGLLLVGGSILIASDIIISRCNYGVKVDDNARIKFLKSTINHCSFGLTINRSDRNEILDCQITECDIAIYFYSGPSRYNIISNNDLSYNNLIGLFIINTQGEIQYNKILNNNVTYNYIGLHIGNDGLADSGYNSICNNVIKDNFFGVKLIQNNDTVAQNRIEENEIGLELKSAQYNRIQSNFFKRNIDWAVHYHGSSSFNDFVQNSVLDNNQGIKIFPEEDEIPLSNQFSCNTILGNDKEFFRLEFGPQQKLEFNTLIGTAELSMVNKYSGKLSANNNYWGTTKNDSIDKIIKDLNDDAGFGEVVYQQTLERPHPEAPIMRPFKAIKQHVSGKVLVSWQRNLEQDLAGYKIYLNNQVIKFCNPEDSTVLLTNVNIDQSLMITAYDKQSDGKIDLLEGHESDFTSIIEMPYAGEDTFICHDDTYWTKTANTRECQSISWLTSGDGKFLDSTRLETFYIPGVNDKSTGLVSLTLQVISLSGKKLADRMDLEIHEYPIIEAGNDTTIAEGEILIINKAVAENYSKLEWTTSGDGTFDDPGKLRCSYTPGIKDIERRFVELTLKLNSSCNNVIDKFTINIIPGYDISGSVSTENSPIQGAVVIAYKVSGQTTEACSIVQTDERGEFKFTDIPYGSYYLYAVADPTDYPSHYPTYWASACNWKQGKLHQLEADLFDVDIKLNRVDTLLPSGEGSINGTCLYQGDTSDGNNPVYQREWFENISHSVASEEAACNHVILLMNPDMTKIIGWAISSLDGSFSFKNLPYGRYRIRGEKAGYENKVSSQFELSKDNPTVGSVSLTINTKNKVINAMVSADLVTQDLVYPNPATGLIFINSSGLEDTTILELRIIDQKGYNVLTCQIERFSTFAFGPVDVSMLKSGIYLCNLTGKNGIVRSSKFIIY